MHLEEVKQIVRRLDEDPGWYQNIDLKNGITTKSRQIWGEEIDHPKTRWGYIKDSFPESFSGKTVCDVGCNAGFFSFIAAERGAKYVCGIDAKQGYIDQAKFANEVRGDSVEFLVGNVTKLGQLGRSFDIMLCIGLLYHIGDIWGAIKAIASVTTEMAIVESAVCVVEQDTPLIKVTVAEKGVPGIWHPNILALRKLFEAAGFRRTEEIFRVGGRGGIVAYK